KETLSDELGIPAEEINADLVGPSWGEQIANKAWMGLGIFMVLVVIYLAIAFEWRMAVAALIALIHDITITVGVYALVGFEVTPGTVIGLLTILGYSLYDTVVVFDSLKEGQKDITQQTRFTYSEIANRSINSTLVRSINTTVVALLPVARTSSMTMIRSSAARPTNSDSEMSFSMPAPRTPPPMKSRP
nr:protein translocase subunit SecF [Streptomyces sp. DSM 41633]